MKYFNGFSLKAEEELFTHYLYTDAYSVVGFSYGAQQAFEYVYETKNRVDKLILLSPAFFQTQKPSFIRTQLRYFEAGKDAYVKQFLTNVTHPSTKSLDKYLHIGTSKELTALLSYIWDKKKLKEIFDRGITIEIFIGEEDKIVDSNGAINFFREIDTLYIVKKSGHLLELTL